ncbi:PREDICTED: probable WRKY transcription factor 19 isoform X2 [Camelina sativa]|uniref:Probable WRKY transcription factor 19 isoform X2 n=1 Tax=Camelina sativa TaxID=90675 RepID=A0ABM0U1C7_CAMSA|nr:PREDICTED: probable WRKY transcription factor 19 isoform X2 [Camelina sativa]
MKKSTDGRRRERSLQSREAAKHYAESFSNMDRIYQSLGVSGPDDLAISLDAWEACKKRSLSDVSSLKLFGPDKDKVLSKSKAGRGVAGPVMMRYQSSLNKTDKEIVVRLLSLRFVDANEKYAVLRKIFNLPGVSSVIVDDSEDIIVTGTVDPMTVRKELKQHRPLLVISRPMRSDESDEEGGSEQLDWELLSLEDAYSDETLSTLWTGTPSASSISGDSDSGNDMTIVAAFNNDWDAFREFLSNRLPPLAISGCSAKDVIDFLRMRQTSGVEAAAGDLVGYLSATWETHGIRSIDNPFRSLDVTTYLRSASEMTGEKECVLVFSCNDNNDIDEASFIEAISKELQKREVTPLMYNLLGKEKPDEKMLYRSSVGIMILSNSCRQSLDHLVEIMEHGKAANFFIIPIYFKATLSDICGFEQSYLQYLDFAQLGSVQKWKAAMAETASNGHEWKKKKQVLLTEEVVRDVCLRLFLKNSKNLSRILQLLNHSQHSEADIVGLWGMPGIGKTSIAREIFGILAPQYDMCYFLQDFYLMCQKKGLRQMRDDFFSKVFGEEKLSISACDIKPSFMKDLFQNQKILLVLDDVSDARDAEAVVGGFGWFSHGHRIILTSRRKQVLVQCKVTKTYEIQTLCEFESFRLCKQYVNEESAVISELVSCSSGIPLAIKVLGFSVSKQHINDMKSHLESLRRNPPTEIQEAFQRSFDGLDENEKNIFLDLACFFRGEDKDHVVQLLDACGFLTYLGICDLIDESLISLLDNKIEIPIPFQDIGRFIVHEEDKDPCERSRLWDSSDIADVLTNNSGTEAIEGIFLNASDLTGELSPIVFGKMYNLRLLKLYCSTSGNECKLILPQGLDTLPDELRLLHWENYPLEYLPRKFNPENLVEINMPYSNLDKLWEEKKNLKKLKSIKLSHSRQLTNILMLSEALNLEHIDLEGCTSLIDVSTSIRHLGKLVSLNMKDCSRLQSLPIMVDLTSLKRLNLSGCSELEDIHDFAPNLENIYLAGTAISELPSSVENLTELVTLDLDNCERLQQLPIGISNLEAIVELKLSGCTSLQRFPKSRH